MTVYRRQRALNGQVFERLQKTSFQHQDAHTVKMENGELDPFVHLLIFFEILVRINGPGLCLEVLRFGCGGRSMLIQACNKHLKHIKRKAKGFCFVFICLFIYFICLLFFL